MYDFSEKTAEDLVAQKIKNLEFFKNQYYGIYEFFSNRDVEHLELQFVPGQPDINVTDGGVELYTSGAVSASIQEAKAFIKIFSKERKIANFALKGSSKPEKGRFSSEIIYQIISGSPVTRRGFDGYNFREIVPCVLFLGSGLGIHIDRITESLDIAHVIVYEPDPDFFSLSLFVVDWESIWQRLERVGRSISFVLSSDRLSDQDILMLENEVKRSVPFHPDFLIFQSHNSNKELIKKFEKVRENLPAVLANRDLFDRQLEHFCQEIVNLRDDIPILSPHFDDTNTRPVVVVGSGHSLDDRIASIKAVRDKIVLVTAGTSLAPVLAFGMEPDFHVELDADYVIYQILNASLAGRDHNITLLAKGTVHPAVLSLFPSKYLFYGAETNNHHVWGISSAFSGAAPTCTNAALGIVVQTGFKKIYLAGSDFGFVSEAQNHSRYSVYGDQSVDSFSKKFQSRANEKSEGLFAVEGCRGQDMVTTGAFFSARLKVESLILGSIRKGWGVEFFSISDGAKIDGAVWLSVDEFLDQFFAQPSIESGAYLPAAFRRPIHLDTANIDSHLTGIGVKLRERCLSCTNIVMSQSVRSVRDLVLLANELRQRVRWLGDISGAGDEKGEFLMAFQLLYSTSTDLIYLLIAHGMACTEEELQPFYKVWKAEVLKFFKEVPQVYEGKVSGVNKQAMLESASSFAHGKL